MGGGDLNMKKSWHPQRLDNMEKVWKLEEAERKERRKMLELQRQLQEERDMEEMQRRGEESGALKKKKDRVDWLYNNPQGTVKEEDYLMGKKVDTAILEHQEQKAKEAVSGGPSLTIDIAAKIKEDPLFAIKKQEINHKKALMNNPIRMKQLQMMLKAQVGAKEKARKFKKHKTDDKIQERKKKRKKSRKDSREEDSDLDSSDEGRSERTMKQRGRKKDSGKRNSEERKKARSGKRNKGGGSKSEVNTRRRDGEKKEKWNKKRRDASDNEDSEGAQRLDRMEKGRSSHHRRESSEEETRRKVPSGYGLIGGHKSSRHQRSSSSDEDERKTAQRHQERDRHGNRYSDRERDGHDGRKDGGKHRAQRRTQSRSRSPVTRPRSAKKSKSKSPVRREFTKKPQKLDAAEMEIRRAEMMDNAKWRDEQRIDRVKRYRAEEKAETTLAEKKDKNAKFLDPMRLPSNSSVEDRIKRNVFSIQRTNAALDKNFARR